MAMYHQKTCIRFVARGTQKGYVKIIRSWESVSGQQNNPGCWSVKGRTGNMQELSLDGTCIHRATVIYELMHALGLIRTTATRATEIRHREIRQHHQR
ncbi:hypothetical protein OUZ56_020494 [Daphnia magna]|uniref:Peptidase M12A domain-containing protein n=1 Tax=Daphnia magna TaxID=35525 RepID=A0ABQ9ZFP5_9CRUS|nr:hypothetical protein OUZ56_020494 [Daphnia magna]